MFLRNSVLSCTRGWAHEVVLDSISEGVFLVIIHSECGIFSAFTAVSKLVGQLPQGEERQKQTYTQGNTLGGARSVEIPETLEGWS